MTKIHILLVRFIGPWLSQSMKIANLHPVKYNIIVVSVLLKLYPVLFGSIRL